MSLENSIQHRYRSASSTRPSSTCAISRLRYFSKPHHVADLLTSSSTPRDSTDGLPRIHQQPIMSLSDHRENINERIASLRDFLDTIQLENPSPHHSNASRQRQYIKARTHLTQSLSEAKNASTDLRRQIDAATARRHAITMKAAPLRLRLQKACDQLEALRYEIYASSAEIDALNNDWEEMAATKEQLLSRLGVLDSTLRQSYRGFNDAWVSVTEAHQCRFRELMALMPSEISAYEEEGGEDKEGGDRKSGKDDETKAGEEQVQQSEEKNCEQDINMENY
ncbi:hypothetical protein P280DRAFT_511603 [Massarina eburnea CBS 473.64]|uniref:Uncharacterized protein n=1 Tax=Massarina eburnea CBS 473.64 TaxID=1395130 RepID=A0A6A6RHX8_9PLEO|nr:hypothetical protein P280DRAFT_511603 [Massarina eburnea CBS 473.64]